MRALVLDFDGVLSDSARESFAVAWRTFAELSPDAPPAPVRSEELYPAFLETMPLGNRAEDYGAVLTALLAGTPLPDQQAYNRLKSTLDPDWLDRFHDRYYEVRRSMSDADPQGWLGLMRPYTPFLELLHRRVGDAHYAIASSKDRRSVDLLLESYGARDLFPPELILDKEVGRNKAAHLERLAGRLALDPREMTFVDDKVNHLDSVAPLGVRCALAGWGYNGPREHRLARRRGYAVLTLADSEAQLFE